MWVSHSFDQRLLWDGSGFVELHLGDAYPRSIALGRFNDQKSGTKTYDLFKPKGAEGSFQFQLVIDADLTLFDPMGKTLPPESFETAASFQEIFS